MKTLRIVLIMISAGLVTLAVPELPSHYRKVDRITWIVRDLDSVIEGWRSLGLASATDRGRVFFNPENTSSEERRFEVRLGTARIGDVEIDWIQPLPGSWSPFDHFLEHHGPGVLSLVHRLQTRRALQAELSELNQQGIGVLLQGSLELEEEPLQFAFLDTVEEGKYSLGLVYSDLDEGRPEASYSQPVPFDSDITQFAFVVRRPGKVSQFWERLGWPEMSITHGSLRNRLYRGEPGGFDHQLGWQRHGAVTYEWCIPLRGPTVYQDHLKKHGEGFHHLGFQVQDLDAVTARWGKLGYPSIQSGAWGDQGKPGSGRFAYMDTDSIGGVTIELLWSYRE